MDRTWDSRLSADVPVSRDTLFRVFLSTERRKRKLPAAPGRSFGCGGAIKNSPVSGAWISPMARTATSRSSSRRSPLSPIALRRARFFIYSFAVCVFGLLSRPIRMAFVSASLSIVEFFVYYVVFNVIWFVYLIKESFICIYKKKTSVHVFVWRFIYFIHSFN